MPDTATLAVVSSVAHRITTRRSTPVRTPMDWASSSPTVSRFIRQRRRNSGSNPTATGSTRKRTSSTLMELRLPMSQ